jgi:hypothetical protein
MIYLFNATPEPTVKGLEPNASYRAYLVNPSTCEEQDLGRAAGNEDGDWPVPQIEVRRDWLVVLERL